MGLIHAVNAPHSMLVCEKSSIFQDFPMRQVRAAPDKAIIAKLKHESILKEMKWKNLRNDVPALRSRLHCSLPYDLTSVPAHGRTSASRNFKIRLPSSSVDADKHSM